jgi:LacI family transcriptional regulator
MEERTGVSTLLEDTDLTVSEQVSAHIIRLIASRGLKRGAALPSYRELERELGVGRMTVKAALDALDTQGIIRRQRARGCYVNREMSTQGKALKTVGIVHTASTEHLFSNRYLREIMQGIGAAPVAAGVSPADPTRHSLDIQIYSMRGEGFVTAAQLADRQVDGVILLGMESDAFVEEVATWGVPGVLVDQVAERVELDCVACDNATAAHRAVQRLVELGHRHIRYVAGDPRRIVQVGASRSLLLRSSDRIERRDVAVQALASIPGLRWDELILANAADRTLVYGTATRWQQESERPTAFLTDNELLAAALERDLSALGIAVPGDVSIAAIACAGEAKVGDKELTGNRVDFTGMGRKAVEVLRRRCEEPAKAPAPQVYRVGSEWVEGSTCGRREA